MIRRSVLVPALVFALAPVGETSARAQDPRPPRVEREEVVRLEREVAESTSSRGWLGVAFTSQNGGPVVIDAVFPDSPADRAGVERGDTVLRVNGEVARNDALRARRFSPGDTVRMELRRGGRERQVRVIAERRGRETIVLRTGDREHGVD
ncbi:MAG TPA: PDZ domain-containing protein, partial [Longimicrobiaceae bacterium]